ncbi:MAG: hypothetical protein QUS14_05525 [Pyrinomonadaceae bacterium]|nr:hypothetical protein [Pyrinomonadaceae bacterium]
MRLSNSAILLAFFALILLGSPACSLWSSDAGNTGRSVSEPQSRIPYPAKEPATFSATFVATAGGTERVAAIVKDGNSLRLDMNIGTGRELTFLQTDKWYVISTGDGVYYETTERTGPSAEPFIADLTSRLLHRRENAEYESLGTENGLAKFRVRVGGSERSEAIVYVDEKLGMPIIQEHYSINGEARELVYRTEMRDVSLEIDPARLQLPPGLKKVSIDEFYKITRGSDK